MYSKFMQISLDLVITPFWFRSAFNEGRGIRSHFGSSFGLEVLRCEVLCVVPSNIMEAIPQHDEKQQLFREQLEANPDAHAADETSTKLRRLASAGFLTLAVLAVVALAAWKVKGEVAEGKVTESQSLFMTCDLPKCEDKRRRRLDASPAPVKSLRALSEWDEWAEWSEDQPEGPYEGTGKGTVCRQSPDDLSSDAFGTAIVEPGKHTVKECSKKCNEKDDCKGFEYGKSDGRCELHVQDICGGTVKQSKEWFPKKETDFQCFPKCQK
jgi:hypothetical protein